MAQLDIFAFIEGPVEALLTSMNVRFKEIRRLYFAARFQSVGLVCGT